MEKILGLDLGSRTCGIAMSDALGMLAHGVETYRFSENAYEKAADYIEKIINENQIKTCKCIFYSLDKIAVSEAYC